jgi:predicted amino acid racemase
MSARLFSKPLIMRRSIVLPAGPTETKYPRLEITLHKIKHNTETLVKMCNRIGIRVAGVTKVFCGHPEIAGAMIEGGIDIIADSRVENLKRLKLAKLPKLLLRLPMISQIDEVVEYADISLNSEVETMERLSDTAISKGKIHKIILMIDLGDLREGIIEEAEIFDAVEKTLTLKGITLIGIGTNLTCYGGVVPDKENLSKLVRLRNTIENKFAVNIEVVSGGNSSSLYLVKTGDMPNGVNQLRLGESIVLGRETSFGSQIEGTCDDCFKLIAEVIEIRKKPSLPIGEIGMNAFGNKPSFVDKGIRKRAICAIGKQDVNTENLIPDDKAISILGASSDHLILDVTDCGSIDKVGDTVSFKLTYGGILSCMNSEYVAKVFR